MHTRRSIVVATAGLLAYQLGAHVAPSINNAAVTLNHAAAVNRASVEMNEDAAKAAWLAKQGGGSWAANRPRFSDKHAGNELTSLQALLEAKDVDFLDRKGKIVATLGPASFSLEMIQKLVKSGVDVFRLNSSHRQPGQFEELIPWIRDTAKAMGRDVKILGDIQGPKFRCTLTEGDVPVPIANGEILEFALSEGDGDLTRPGRITLADTVEQNALVKGLEPGMSLLLDDGFMAIEVVERKSPTLVTAVVTIGGNLKSRKGINVPQLQIDCSALTAKDREDATYLLTSGPGGSPVVDYIALSFAQRGQDIQVPTQPRASFFFPLFILHAILFRLFIAQELTDLMDACGVAVADRPDIIPKIEKPAALKNIDEILALSDGLMVARGDLGVELGLHRVPFAQKFLVRKANDAGKFCITATQMMESMIEAVVPTRAEVSDVANAIFDGTDAVMLSGESAMGVDPANTVEWMGSVIAEAEAHADDVAPSF